MTGGSSGGGWITGGSLNSVTSFGYNSVPNILWGPYFGSTIQSVYNTARGLPDSITRGRPSSRGAAVHSSARRA